MSDCLVGRRLINMKQLCAIWRIDALESIGTVSHLASFSHDLQDPSKVDDLYVEFNAWHS